MMSELIAAMTDGTVYDYPGRHLVDGKYATMFMAYTPPNSKIPDPLDDTKQCVYPLPPNPPC